MDGELDAEEQSQLTDINSGSADIETKEYDTCNTQRGDEHDTGTCSYAVSGAEQHGRETIDDD